MFCFLLFACLGFMAHLLALSKSLWLQYYVLIQKKPFPGFFVHFFSEIVFHLCTILKNIRDSTCCRKFGVSDIWHSYMMKPSFQSPANLCIFIYILQPLKKICMDLCCKDITAAKSTLPQVHGRNSSGIPQKCLYMDM